MTFGSNNTTPSSGGGGKGGTGVDLTPKDIALVVGLFAAGFFVSWLFLQSGTNSGPPQNPNQVQYSERPAERRIDMQGHRQNSSFSGASGSGFSSPEAAVVNHRGGSARSQTEIESEARQFAPVPASDEIASAFSANFPREGQRTSQPIDLFALTEELDELPRNLSEFDLDKYLDESIPEEARRMGLTRELMERHGVDQPPPQFR